ncbi:MAG: glycosyltransferase family 2 protein [Actinomycetota bacterium]|nr:glycosyltransferase family 2 protein [Actinomycetota bacterium]
MDAGAPPAVTVAVVSWNTRDLLLRCLRALEPEVRSGRAEVWVVDNGSDDGSAPAARRLAPWATVVEPGENLGFGRAVNLVAAGSRGVWVACANADTELEPGALERLLSSGAAPEVGCVAPLLALPDGTPQHSVHSLPTIPFTLALNLGLYRLSGRLADRMLLSGMYDPQRPRPVAWAYGAFLLIRRTAFEQVRGFDERQWMYAEDLDLCWRLREHGWSIGYEPRARVGHAGGASTRQVFGDQPAARFMHATYAAILRHRGPLRTWVTAALNVLGAASRLAWISPLALISSRWRGPRRELLMWLSAHREGLRRPSRLHG